MTTHSAGRRAGVAVPLFSLRSRAGWGIGEFRDLPRLADWCAHAGLSVVQVLPLNEMPPGETSPYSAMTGMALDPIYLAIDAVPDCAEVGGDGLTPDERSQLAQLRASERIRYAGVRALKFACLRRGFARFELRETASGTPRARAFEAFCAEEAWWLDEYAAFRAMHASREDAPWWTWPETWRHPQPGARLGSASLETDARFRRWLQWLCTTQWAEARASSPVAVFGDLPFMVAADSPDVWARQPEFRFDGSVGVPPDAFSETGQDWGLPPWRAAQMQEGGWVWMRARARRTAALYDGVRLDHLVGLYRMYVRPRASDGLPPGPGQFEPADDAAQLALGETLVRLYQSEGIELIAEDLGVVPDAVRASIARLGVPGFKVMRWERLWDAPGQPFIDPGQYPELSVALTGTHDTETLAGWWTTLAQEDRTHVRALPSVARHLGGAPTAVTPGSVEAGDRDGMLLPTVRDAMLRALYDSPARLVLIPLTDLFGWDARINRPATIADTNWTWRMADPLDDWTRRGLWTERARTLRAWAESAGRL